MSVKHTHVDKHWRTRHFDLHAARPRQACADMAASDTACGDVFMVFGGSGSEAELGEAMPRCPGGGLAEPCSIHLPVPEAQRRVCILAF